jgi:hypothetical protein
MNKVNKYVLKNLNNMVKVKNQKFRVKRHLKGKTQTGILEIEDSYKLNDRQIRIFLSLIDSTGIKFTMNRLKKNTIVSFKTNYEFKSVKELSKMII